MTEPLDVMRALSDFTFTLPEDSTFLPAFFFGIFPVIDFHIRQAEISLAEVTGSHVGERVEVNVEERVAEYMNELLAPLETLNTLANRYKGVDNPSLLDPLPYLIDQRDVLIRLSYIYAQVLPSLLYYESIGTSMSPTSFFNGLATEVFSNEPAILYAFGKMPIGLSASEMADKATSLFATFLKAKGLIMTSLDQPEYKT